MTTTATLACVPGLPTATKTPIRPKRRQSNQKRSWQNLTDRRKLRHLETTLDKAITRALQQGGIESHEDFKAYAEVFSERVRFTQASPTGKAPITVELCEGGGNDDEIRGYRFYLTSDLSQRTSGKYLIKNLEGVTDKDENYFTPSNIAEMFGFEEAEFADLDDALDRDNDFDEEPDEDLDTLLDAELDAELDDLEDAELAPSKHQAKTSTKAQSRTQSKAQAQGKVGKFNHRDFRCRDPMEDEVVAKLRIRQTMGKPIVKFGTKKTEHWRWQFATVWLFPDCIAPPT